MAGSGDKHTDLENLVAESVAKSLPAVLQDVLPSLSLPGQNEPKESVNTVIKSIDVTPVQTTSRGDRFHNTEQETVISQDLLSFTNKAYSRSLSKDKWKEMTTSYTQIKDTESLLAAPTMEAGMKEELKKRHGYTKTKELLAFDDGLAERQCAFLVVARPLLAALTALDNSGEEDKDEGPDPDAIKDLLEDAPVGNANFRLNSWRQKRFSAFLSEVGKRTLREGIPADKHLFPDKFHAKIKSEHDHSSTNSKLISTPASKHFSRGPHRREQHFRGNFRTMDNSRVGGKRKWGCASRSNLKPPKGPEQQDPPPCNLTPRPAPADHLFPCLKLHTPPPTDQQLVYNFLFRTGTNNTGHLDFTNNSGVQDSLLQTPQAMAHENNQSEMPLGCSPCGNSYRGRRAAGQPVHFNPFLSTKINWRLSSYHQPPCFKPVLGAGGLQDGGTASSVRTPNSSLPQEVSEVHLSGENIRVSVPSLWPVLSSAGIHKDSEASAGSDAVHGYPGCDIHRRHVINPPTEQGTAENRW